ncbi:MAG: hypothetical protein WC552_09195 [Candidatus Omnitrophota bacterium]
MNNKICVFLIILAGLAASNNFPGIAVMAESGAAPVFNTIGPVTLDTESGSDPYNAEGTAVATGINGAALFEREDGLNILVFPETKAVINGTSGLINIESGLVAFIADAEVENVDTMAGSIAGFRGIALVELINGCFRIVMLDSGGTWENEVSAQLVKGRIYEEGTDGEIVEKDRLNRGKAHGYRRKVEVYLSKTISEPGPFLSGSTSGVQPLIIESEGCVQVCPIE